MQEIFNQAVAYRGGPAGSGSLRRAFLRRKAARPESARAQDFLEKFIEKDIALPEIPSIVYELNEVIANPLSSADQMAQVINKSPSLTALLLKIVNSSFYGLPSRVDRVSLAVTLIGTRELSALALGISILSMFKKIPSSLLNMHSFLQHSLACGIVSRLLAAQKNMRQTEQMFTAGLLHDLGRLILFIYFPEETLSVLRDALENSTCLLRRWRKKRLGCHHGHIGKYLLNRWRLPLILENAVCFHHEPRRVAGPGARRHRACGRHSGERTRYRHQRGTVGTAAELKSLGGPGTGAKLFRGGHQTDRQPDQHHGISIAGSTP